jgi:hypothetical protein
MRLFIDANFASPYALVAPNESIYRGPGGANE